MTPEVRAVADRFIMDAANLKYLATRIPKGGLERPVEAVGWTVRQTIGHLVAWQERYARMIDDLLADTPTAAGFDSDEFNAAAAEQARSTPLPDLLGRLDLATARLLALFEGMPPGTEDREVAGHRLADLLRPWSEHIAEHGIDLLDALPEVRFDPMILNWILYAVYSGDARRLERQVSLMADVRERFGDDDEYQDDDESEEENDDAS
jgi:uncharacterized damage-inducible protein DinB